MLLLGVGETIGIVFGILGLLLLIIFMSGVRIVRQTSKYIVERLGAYHDTWGVGIHYKWPFFDKIAAVVSMKEQIKDFDPQPVITKDNVTMQIDTVIFYSVTDPKLYLYGVEDPISGIEKLSVTTLRNIIGELDLDQTLTSRDIINTKMRAILDEATDPWGIKVTRVEVKNILPPQDIRDSMERQMRAEREKREQILLAEGQKQSAILVAEGQKESAILAAEGQKEARIKAAEAEAESIRQVKEAEAEGLLAIRKAEAESIKVLNEANPSDRVLTIKSFEALEKVADGKATKLVVPTSLTNVTSLASVVKEVMKDDAPLAEEIKK
jgi:regulator of protease activity HflC (stomatin/prohibitin superfamily)